MDLALTVSLSIIIANVLVSLAAPALDGESFHVGKEEELKKFRESYAVRMRSFMNTSVDPCDDFYEYACGNYPNVIEDTEVTFKRNNLYDLSHESDGLIDKILQKERQVNDEYYKELQKVKFFVETCNDAKLFPLQPSEEYLEAIKVIGGFPAVDGTWNASSFDWFNMTAHLVRYGVVGLIKEEIFMKYPFPPYYEIPKFGFDFDVHSDNIGTNSSKGYFHNAQIMRGLLEIYGVSSVKADKVIEEVIEFWREALLFQELAHDRRGCRVRLVLEDIEDYEFPQWNSLFEIAWNSEQFVFTDYSECPCDWYFKNLDEIATKKPEAIANYLALKFLYTMHPQLKSTKYQHQHCVTQAKKTMPLVLTHFFMKEHFSQGTKKEIEEMIAELKKAFTSLVKNSDWLDDETRLGATTTIQNLETIVGEIADPLIDTYIKQMQRLNFTSNHAQNNLELATFHVEQHHYAFLQPKLSNTTVPFEVLDAIQVNAFYDLSKHRIAALAGVLIPPLYHRNLPEAVKYGSLGYIIGHEIVHSLDFRGREFEIHFNIPHVWSEKSALDMKNRSSCFVQHHREYVVPVIDVKLNGTKTLKEAVADSGGLREAYAAYRTVFENAIESKGDDFAKMELLPGLNLTTDQTFFLSFAQVYCAKYEPKDYWREISENHPMDRYRVIGSLQNMQEFSSVYKCSEGSRMNPTQKCRLW